MASGDDTTDTDDASGDAPSEPRYDLTEHELHDVTVVTTAENEFEAVALIEALEEAGIPAMKRGGIVHLSSLGQREVLVPRKLFEAARAEILKSRSDATERGVADAFKPENADVPSSPENGQSAPFSSVARGGARERKLFDFVAQSISDSMPAPKLAQHLAAEGLTREEADALIQRVKTEHSDLIRGRLEARAQLGYVIGVAGIIFFAIGLYLSLSPLAYRAGLFVLAGSFGTAIGFGLSHHASSKLAALNQDNR